jgi:hypothetical protein
MDVPSRSISPAGCAPPAFLAAVALSSLRRGADIRDGQSVATHPGEATVTAAP